MKKSIIVFFVAVLLLMGACSSDIEESNSPTSLSKRAPTLEITASPEPEQKPTTTPAPNPTQTQKNVETDFISLFESILLSSDVSNYRLHDSVSRGSQSGHDFYVIYDGLSDAFYPFSLAIKPPDDEFEIIVIGYPNDIDESDLDAFIDICAFAIRVLDDNIDGYDSYVMVISSEESPQKIDTGYECSLQYDDNLILFKIINASTD